MLMWDKRPEYCLKHPQFKPQVDALPEEAQLDTDNESSMRELEKCER